MITPLSEALAERGFDQLTQVQESVIAAEVAQADLLVSAQTGSGKTVGFGLAIAPTLMGTAERFGPADVPLALIIAPTRELATQVMRELAWLYARTGAVVTSCVGGMDMRQERRALERGAHIVVGTPGRLRDHIERGALDLSGLRAIVLDEADEMLDMGFREDLEFMLGRAPDDRRTLMFSATVPAAIAKLAQKYQRNAHRISATGGSDQHADIAYQAVRVAAPDVDNAVFNLLRFHDDQSAIVFANTRATVKHLGARLANRGLATVTLSGELSQTERTHALQAMRDGRARVCVATDVAARGIDLPKLTLVIHADLPTNTESLLHRSGRTGRAGRKGISALIVPPKALRRAEQLLKSAKISAEWTVPPSADDIVQRDEARLMDDPAWSEPPSADEAAFASRLLARHAPEAIAAAFVRLHHTRHAAPEDLLPPDTPTARREPRAFGPSRWVALSVGREGRAEARWLLPLLCRAGKLDKSAIGAIRVQTDETFVELAEPSVAGFFAALGPEGMLEQGITARPHDGPPTAPSPARTTNHRPEAPRPVRPTGAPAKRSNAASSSTGAASEAVTRKLGDAARPPSGMVGNKKPRADSKSSFARGAPGKTSKAASGDAGDGAARPRPKGPGKPGGGKPRKPHAATRPDRTHPPKRGKH